jgi:hypothetical protein
VVPEPKAATPAPVKPAVLKEKPFFEKVREEKLKEKPEEKLKEPEEIFEEPIIEKTAPPIPPLTFQTVPEPEVVMPPLQAEPYPSEPVILKEEPFIETVEEEKSEEEELKEEPEKEELKEEPFIETVEEEKFEEEELKGESEEEKLKEEPEEEFEEPIIETPPVKTVLMTVKEEEPIIEEAAPTPVSSPPAAPPPPVETVFKPAKEIIPEMRVIQPPVEEVIVEEDKDTVTIAGCKITIEIPPHILEQTQTASTEQKRKIAGVLAAQTLEKNPQLTASPTVDPVSVWSDILNAIMNKL